MTTEKRVMRLENAFSTLAGLARKQSEPTGESERRTEGLAQAQKELAEAQKQTDAHLSALTVIVADTGRAMTNLAERFDKQIGGN